MVLPLGLAILCGDSTPRLKCFGMACLVISVGIGPTLSRGGVLDRLRSGFLFWLLGIVKIGPGLVALVGMIALSYFAVAQSSLRSNPSSISKESLADLNVRPLVWAGINTWKDHVFGVGPGQFDALFPLLTTTGPGASGGCTTIICNY